MRGGRLTLFDHIGDTLPGPTVKLRACAFGILLGLAVAHATAAGEPKPSASKPEAATAPSEALFPASGSSAAQEPNAAAKRTPPTPGMFEYPSGDASPVCVNPPRR